ncbi:uncharacterized protein RHO25_009404 [Cercospora beticola]|uniref:F-box domain-containing protein n=1 Tax=Cercospora beticola TaxID=122368 RepID=A0ABZ0NZ80_CERBT|nr:hypothetical protein RHO25_009404 [Cercospora beticola]
MGKSNKMKMHKPAKIESQYSGMRGSWTEKEYSRGVDYEDSTALQQRSDDLCEQNADRFSEAARWPELTRANLRPKIKNNVARKVSFARPRGGCSYSSKLRTAVEENEKRPPVVNFPLPAEIREHIYSYLLNADEVESPPETHSCLLDRSRCQAGTCSLPTFLFQKQMFRVNKTIGSEALHYFRRENKIVQFQFKNHDLFRHCVTFDVPVFYSQMPRSQSHMFTINVDWNRGRREYYLPVDALRNGIVFEASREKLQNNRPFLVLGKHLPKVLPLLRHYWLLDNFTRG